MRISASSESFACSTANSASSPRNQSRGGEWKPSGTAPSGPPRPSVARAVDAQNGNSPSGFINSHLPTTCQSRLGRAVRIARGVRPADAEQSQNPGIWPRGDVKRYRSQQPAAQLELAVAKIVWRIDVANAERQMIRPARLLRRNRW